MDSKFEFKSSNLEDSEESLFIFQRTLGNTIGKINFTQIFQSTQIKFAGLVDIGSSLNCNIWNNIEFYWLSGLIIYSHLRAFPVAL